MVIVCFPYEFTLLSNLSPVSTSAKLFVSPTNLHCSQTTFLPRFISAWFVSPTNLHCSQTYITFLWYPDSFVSPTNLHCSQTVYHSHSRSPRFVSPTNLHCSQTHEYDNMLCFCLFPLRIYTALKPQIVQE